MSGFAVSLPFEWSKPHAMIFFWIFLKAKDPIIISQQPENCENRNDNIIPYQSRKVVYGGFDGQLHL